MKRFSFQIMDANKTLAALEDGDGGGGAGAAAHMDPTAPTALVLPPVSPPKSTAARRYEDTFGDGDGDLDGLGDMEVELQRRPARKTPPPLANPILPKPFFRVPPGARSPRTRCCPPPPRHFSWPRAHRGLAVRV